MTAKSTAASTTSAAPKTAAANGKPALRKPVLRVLEALAKAKAPLTRKDIAVKADMPHSGLVFELGSLDADKRAANDAKMYPSLLTLGYVKVRVDEEVVGTLYEITAAGRKALERASK